MTDIGSAIGDNKVSVAPATNVAVDPLLTLLQRYEAEVAVFDRAQGADLIADEVWDTIAEQTWFRTQGEIIAQQPSVTTVEGALLALDHVLQSDELFGERTEWPHLQMLWVLIKAARDYIVAKEGALIDK